MRPTKGETRKTPASAQAAAWLNALPGGGDFDQDTIPADAGLLVQADQFAGPLHGGLALEGETGIHLCGDAAGNDGQDLLAHIHSKPVAAVGQLLRVGTSLAVRPGLRLVQQFSVMGQGRGFQQQ